MSIARFEVAVLGAGAWGTALALALARRGGSVALWARRPDQAIRMLALRVNGDYLPGAVLPPNLQTTADLRAAVAEAQEILVAVPSHAFRDTVRAIAPLFEPRTSIAWATKGLEPRTLLLLSEVARQELPGLASGVVISGPSFAAEVTLELPTALTAASSDPEAARGWAKRLSGPTLRVYTSDDPIGVQIGGALKNVFAIAAGICDGLGYGANARAALITRGLAEMRRLGDALGAKGDTFVGLAGVGDLVLTCTDDQSRNRRAGLAIAAGQTRDQIRAEIGQVVEGFTTVEAAVALAKRFAVEVPICDAVFKVVYGGADPRQVVAGLLLRELRSESPI